VYFCAAPEGTPDAVAVAGSGVGVGVGAAAPAPHGVDCAATGVGNPAPPGVDASEDDADGAAGEADVGLEDSGFCAMASARGTVKSLKQ
jgi:hypothetical protein